MDNNIKTLKEYLDSLPEEHQEIIKEFNKVKIRLHRHGENVVNNRGRKQVSEEHKKEVKKAYYKRKSEEQKQRKIADGTYRSVGRPRKEII